MTRRGKSFVMFTVYYYPTVVDVCAKQIPVYWRKFPHRLVEDIHKVVKWWEGMGEVITGIPCASAYPDPDERAAKCKTGGGEDEELFTPDPTKEVVEGLDMGAIGKLIKMIIAFFTNIGVIIEAVVSLFVQFPTDPFGTIFNT
jgi:hypothetical protein